MSMLSDGEIREAINDERLRIGEFSEAMLQPCSYDLRLGTPAFLVHERKYVSVGSGPDHELVLNPGQYALVRPIETILNMPQDMAATIGAMGSWARLGLVLSHGPLVDPGFKGELWFGILNSSSSSLRIPYGRPFATLAFFTLGQPAAKRYEGRLTPRDYMDVLSNLPRTRSVTELDQMLTRLDQELEHFKARTEKWEGIMQWTLPTVGLVLLLVAAVVTVVAALAVFALSKTPDAQHTVTLFWGLITVGF